jgi:hypothetical protein
MRAAGFEPRAVAYPGRIGLEGRTRRGLVRMPQRHPSNGRFKALPADSRPTTQLR